MNFISKAMRKPQPKLTLSRMALAVAAVTVSHVAMAETLQNISVTQPTTAMTELNIDFVGQPIKPVAYQLESPTRLVLDFANVDNKVPRVMSINRGNIKTITTLSNDTTTRLIVELGTPAQYTVRTQGNRLVVAMQNPTSTLTAKPNVEPVVVQPAPVITAPMDEPVTTTKVEAEKPANTMMVKVNPLLNPAASTNQQYSYDGLASINQRSSGAGGTDVSINLTNDSIPLDVQRSGDELVIRMSGATIPSNLLRQMNVGNGLVRNIVTNNQGRNGIIRIAMNGDYEYKAYQTGGQLNISINPPKKIRQPTLAERTYTGAPISMDFENMDVRQVLKVLAMTANTNIVASDSVTGNITLSLIDIPWDQALDIILKAKNLDKRVNGKVIWVAPAKELQTSEAEELEAQQKIQDLAPIRTEYIRLNYSKAADVRTLIEAKNSSKSGQDSGSLLSPRGTVTIDDRTNTLIIKDTSDNIVNIRELIAKIDIPVKQVMIEARIVSASDTFSKEIGVKWGILSNGISNNRNLLVGGSEQTLWDLKKYDIKTQTVNGQTVSYPSYTITRPDNLNVDLGATAANASSIAFGLLTMSDLLIDLELSAMQADGKGEVISSPKVLTADKQTAKVMSGTQIPYQEATASGATSTSYKDAALSLEVTPNITPEGRIGMNLKINNSSIGAVTSNGLAINTDAIETNVLVDDGQTVVLGGVFKNTLGNTVDKVPFLGDLPYVGNLFKKTSKTNQKNELLIFVTPKVVNEGVSRIN